MKNLKSILALMLVALIAVNSNAQLKKFGKNVLKDKVMNSGKDKESSTESSTPEPTSTPSEPSNAAPAATEKTTAEAPAKTLDLDWNTFNLTPAITMSSLLYGTIVYERGSTSLESYTASFVPYKKTDGSLVSSIYDQSEFLKVKVYKGDQFIDYFEYDGSTTFDDNKLRKFNAPSSRYKKNGDWADGTNIDLKKWGEGNYRLDFYAGTKMFYSFDFEVYKLVNNDPYAKLNEMYLSRGPWNKYAYFEHQESGNLIFGFYLNHEEFAPNPSDPNKTTKDMTWSLKILKDGKPYAKHFGNGDSPKKEKIERARWTKCSTALKSADGKTTIKLADLTDGAYKVELTVDGEAKPRNYSFNVKDKRIVLMDEQDRSKNTDPTHLIEGWNNFFWLKLENK